MAGEWIKWTKGLYRKPEVLQIAVALNLDPFSVAARCMAVWEWADDNTIDGSNAVGVTKVTVHALIDGITGVTGFADAMIACGWLRTYDDRIEFPNGSRHNGQPAKMRALTARRVANHKAGKKRQGNGVGNAMVTVTALPREEKRRDSNIPPLTPHEGGEGTWAGVLSQIEQDIQQPPPRPQRGRPHRPDVPTECVPIPPALDTPELREAWYDWHEYQRQRGTPITQAGAREQMRLMSQWGADRAVKAIRYSMAMGYAGMIEPKTGEQGQAEPKPAGENPDAHLPPNVRAMLRRKAELEAQGMTEEQIREELEKMR